MAYTEHVLQGTGTTGPYAIGFNYRSADSIKVFVDGVLVEHSFAGTPSAEQPGGTTVQLAQATSGVIRIVKQVALDAPAVHWDAGSELDQSTLQTMNLNLMEMAQTAYDSAGGSKEIAEAAQAVAEASAASISSTLSTHSAVMQGLLDLATAQAADAEYWAGIAEAGASVANPSGVAEAARDAAIAAKNAAEAARDLALAYRNAAQTAQAASEAARDTASSHASAAAGSASAAAASATQAQDIVNAGSLKWNGSARFISTSAPDDAIGANGDFWFRREV